MLQHNGECLSPAGAESIYPLAMEKKYIRDSLTESILESISDGVFTVDDAWRITSFNRAAEEITGIKRHQAIGAHCWEIFRSNMCKTDCALRSTMESGTPIINRSANIINNNGDQVPITISTALLRNAEGQVIGGAESFRDLTVVEDLRRELEGRIQIGDLITRSISMQKIIDMIPQIASSNCAVLIEGETGTGKELLARAIHDLSERSDKPFIALNCGALPDSLLESELFGFKAGAFTGANKDKAGRFALAEGGTLFLDEIGEISHALQVRFLRVLQEKAYEPLGSTQTVKTDVRIIAATNRILAGLVATGEFRQDLFYRINVVKINIPPLRERKEDIPLLLHHFIARFNRRQRKSIKGVSMDALAVLLAHEFPGNVRELENIIEHAFVLRDEGMITLDNFPEEFLVKPKNGYSPIPGVNISQPAVEQQRHPNNNVNGGMESVVHAAEAQTIIEALKRNNFNRIAAARELGIHKSTLFRKIRTLGIDLPQVDGRFRPYYGMGEDHRKS